MRKYPSVIKVDGFLSEPKKCSDYVDNLLSEHKNNFGIQYAWNRHTFPNRDDANHVPSPILIHYLKEGNPSYFEELKQDIDMKLSKEGVDDLEVYDIIFHVMTEGAWINWHIDGLAQGYEVSIQQDVRRGALTIYLNNEWGLDKGGEFLYNMDDKVERVIPSFNKGLFILGGVEHKTTPVVNNNLRKTLQVWLKRKGS